MQISKYIQLNRLWISVVDQVNLVNKFNTFSKSSHENKNLPLYCTFRTERKRLYFKVKGQKADFSDLCLVALVHYCFLLNQLGQAMHICVNKRNRYWFI